MAEAPRDFAVHGSVRVAPTRWQWIGDFTTTPVAAYELKQAKARALVFVTRMAPDGLPVGPPLKPQRDTGGRAVAWWQSGTFVYVLVVEDVNDYHKFVQPSTPPLA
jgi:hypothetical protein